MKKLYGGLYIILLCFFYNNYLFSQDKYYLELKPFSGFVAPHRVGMESLAQDPIFGTEINFIFQSNSDNVFDKFYNYPYIGGGISIEYLGNPSMLGNSYSTYAFMEFKTLKHSNLNLNVRIGGGLAYLTKKYDAVNNPENIAIGSKLTFHFNLGLIMYYSIPNTNLDLRLSGGLIHNSNGSVKKPNLGLNQVFFSGGVAYKFKESKKDSVKTQKVNKAYAPHEFHAMATIIKNDDYTTDYIGRNGNYYCSTFAIGYNYRYSFLGKVGISFDLFHNQNFYYYYDEHVRELIRKYDSPKDILRSGISLGHELIYKKIGLITYIGTYVNRSIKPDDYFYFRVGLRYYPIKNIYVNITLKCFGFKAHYIESGIGFSIYKNKKNKDS